MAGAYQKECNTEAVGALNTIENGLTSPTLRQLEAIAIALDTKISALYDSEYK